MRECEIIEKIHKIYDQKEPDVLSRLDFSKVEMKTVPEKSLKKRYFSAAAVYAAACLVIVAVLPFLIGGMGDETKPAPGNFVSESKTEAVTYGDTKPEENPLLEVNIADSVPEEYRDVLVQYRSAVEAVVTGNIIDVEGFMGLPYEPVHAFTAGMYEAGKAMNYPEVEKYGYSLKDMNGDGIPELLLITENHVLLELYTIIDGKAQMLDSFSPRYTGVVLTENNIYTRGSSGATCCSYTLRKYNGAGKLVPYMEFGYDVSDDGKHYYKVTDGEREIIKESTFLALCERYPEIPVFSGEGYTLTTKMEYYSISPTVEDKFMGALKRGVEEGRIEDREYDRNKLFFRTDEDKSNSGIHVFCFELFDFAFVLYDSEVCPVETDLPVYMLSYIQECDVDKNGKEDLLIYGTWGSGVYGYSLVYFDSDTKTVADLYTGAFAHVNVVEETGDDGDIKYAIYAYMSPGGTKEHYVGTLEYENGKIVTDLIREGTLSEVIKDVLHGGEDNYG